jgi:hypothetical protein
VRTTTITFTLILVLAFTPFARTAPAPTEEQLAKAKLETLKKKLPETLTDGVNKSERWSMKYEATVQSLRLIGPTEAKLTVRLEAFARDQNGTLEKAPPSDEILVIYLTFYDGAWTTRRFEGTWNELDTAFAAGGGPGGGRGVANPRGNRNNRAAKFLLAAIDDLTEKKD